MRSKVETSVDRTVMSSRAVVVDDGLSTDSLSPAIELRSRLAREFFGKRTAQTLPDLGIEVDDVLESGDQTEIWFPTIQWWRFA